MSSFSILIILLYDLAVLFGTAYLVAVMDWNPWWFLFAMCVLVSPKEVKDD